MKAARILLPLAWLLSGCGASSGSPTPSPATLAILVNGRPAQQVVLTDSQFIMPDTFIATLTVDPAASGAAWTQDSETLVKLSLANPTYDTAFGGASPTPPPGGTFVYIGSGHGKAVVSATVAGRSASIPVYTYPSLALRCQFRYQAAYAFDPGAVPTGLTSDLYATETTESNDPLDPCSKTVFVTGVSAVHFPYGGVVVTGDFPSITASQWRNAATQLPESAIDNGVLLFKTKAGRIVKAMLPLGAYEVSNANGTFPY